MNYAEMKRTFKRGGIVTPIEGPAVVSLKEMFSLFPVGKRSLKQGCLRDMLRGAASFVPEKLGSSSATEIPQ